MSEVVNTGPAGPNGVHSAYGDDSELIVLVADNGDHSVRPAPLSTRRFWLERLERAEFLLTQPPIDEAALTRFRDEWQPTLHRLRAELQPPIGDGSGK